VPEFTSPMLRRWELGNALRRIRDTRGMTIADVTIAMKERYGSSFSTTKLSRIETAKRGVIPRDVHDLCIIYGVPDDEREHLVELAKLAREPEDFQTDDDSRGYLWYIALERIATRLREYHCVFLPGLLQTAEYAMAVENVAFLNPEYYYTDLSMEDLPDTAEGRSALRLERQKLLDRNDPLELHTVIDEGALHRRFPQQPEVMERQLRHLIEVSKRPNIHIQVIPFGVGLYPGAEISHWSILDFPPGDHFPTRTVYLEAMMGPRTVDHEADVARIDGAFTTLASHIALDAEDSRSLIERILNDTRI